MYICLDCGKLFEEPRKYVETHGFDSPPYEEWYGCPECGGVYTETKRCDNCGRWIRGEYIKLDGGYYYCDNCYEVRDIGD